MGINKRRHKITIEKNQGSVSDGAGNKIPVWLPVLSNIWAEVKPLNGSETNVGGKTGQQLTHNVNMLYKAGIEKDNHRVNFNGRILVIEYIINKDERNIELNLQCVEG